MSQSHRSRAYSTRATVALKVCLGKVPNADVCKTANWNLVHVPSIPLRCRA